MENGLAVHTDGALQSPLDTNDGQKKSPTSPNKSNGHKRGLSNTILSRLNFLRTSQEEVRPTLEQLQDGGPNNAASTSHSSESAMALAQKAAKGRRRKGSLRKTALLGTGKFMTESRERRNSLLQRRPSTSLKQTTPAVVPTEGAHAELGNAVSALRRTFSYELPVAASSSDSSWSIPQAQSLQIATTAEQSIPMEPSLASPIKSPTSQSYASTTDEEEALSFSRPANGHAHQQTLKGPPSSSSSSYFPPSEPITRRRSSTKPGLSPLSALPMDAYSPEEEWDYSETERWGWVVLIVTWIVFVVGMGSCLEVWSWAWDVGQTPYAPPELEDDPTLPIVGYYPALIILTAVMAWVWVVVAWVGMKYFKHAKIQGDDT